MTVSLLASHCMWDDRQVSYVSQSDAKSLCTNACRSPETDLVECMAGSMLCLVHALGPAFGQTVGDLVEATFQTLGKLDHALKRTALDPSMPGT